MPGTVSQNKISLYILTYEDEQNNSACLLGNYRGNKDTSLCNPPGIYFLYRNLHGAQVSVGKSVCLAHSTRYGEEA